MRDRLSTVLHLTSGVLVFSGYLALASVLQYGLGLMLLPLILLPLAPVGGWLEGRLYGWRVLRRVAAIVYMCFIPFSVSMLGLMDAVIALVIFIQAYLLLGEKSVRVYYEIYLMAFFLLLAAVVQSPEPLIAIALLLFGVSAVWAFTALRMHSEQLRNPARGLPEVRSLKGDMTTIRLGNIFDFGVMLSLSVLSLLTILLTVVVFLFTPRVEAGWLGRRDARQALTGLSETVRLTGGANITEDQTVVMHVRFPEEPAGVLTPAGDLYWRVTTLSRFSGDEWSRRGLNHIYEPDIDQIFGMAGRLARHTEGLEAGRRLRDNTRPVQQVVYMDDVPTQGVPILDVAQGIKVLGEPANTQVFWDGYSDLTIQLQTSGTRRLQYEAYSEIRPRDPEALRQAPFDFQYMEPRDYSLLTYEELLPETRQLARTLAAPHNSIYDKVSAINDYLGSEAYAYSLQVPVLPAQNGMDAFINEIRRGHCELFASALALMTRSLGIPARVVSGYRGGEYMVDDQAYLVRASMSHLWVEVLFPEHGWVRFDPSPRSDIAPGGFRRMQMAWSLYLLRAKMFWFQEVIGFQGSIRLDNLRWPWSRKRAPIPIPQLEGAGDTEEEPQMPRDYTALLQHPAVQLTALVACHLGGWFLWRRWRKRRATRVRLTRDQQRMRKLYLRFLRATAKLGIDCSNKTAGEIRHDLMRLGLTENILLDEFITIYNAVRFGGRPLTPEQQNTFKQHLRHLRSRTL
jgi:protein-glutamine gamma-glutamyltransferase